MTWGIKRRARAANILADLGKIITAAAVIGLLVQPGPVLKGALFGWMAVGLAFLVGAIWAEKEE